MTVTELIRELKREKGHLQVLLFAHDHNPEKHDEGVGPARSVWETKDDKGDIFVAICG